MQAPTGVGGSSAGVIKNQSPPFAIPVRYMILGVVCFGVFAIYFALQSSGLAQGDPGAPHVVAMTHLLTLGALLSFVMGAVYQLTTVAFLIPISSVPMARWNFWVYLGGVAGLFYSMDEWWGLGFLIFGLLTAAAIYLYAFVTIASLWKTEIRGAMFGFVVSAHAYLILAVSLAVLLVLVDSGSAPALNHVMGELIATHILFAVGGFFTFLVMGFSFKLLPMFTLSHGFSTTRQKWTLTLAHVALWLVVAGVWIYSSVLMWVGAVIGTISLVHQLLDIRGILKKRMRKKLEPPIRAVVAGTIGGALGLCLLIAQITWGPGQAGWQGVVMFYLLGAVTLTVIGFAYKIVPFLIWSKRYSRPTGKGKPVLISDLIHLNQAWPVLIAFVSGLLGLVASSTFEWKFGTIGSAILMALAILTFCVQILKVVDLRKIGKELLWDDESRRSSGEVERGLRPGNRH